MILLANLIHRIIQLFILVVIIQAVLSYFMDPYHPVRKMIDQIVNPLLTPIRRILPPIANLDLSPIVLIIILQILDRILTSLLYSFG